MQTFHKQSRLLMLATLASSFFFVFIFSLKPILDTDFGWHLRTGQWILSHQQVPTTDLFTHSHPDYPYVYHSWLMEVLYAFTHSLAGLWGISFFLALLITVGYAFLTNISKSYPYHPFYLLVIPATVFPLTTLTGSSSRTQAITFLFLALTHYLLDYSLTTKHSGSYWFWLVRRRTLLLPLIFTIWANSHGGFVLGIVFSLTYLVTFFFSLPFPISKTNTKLLKYTSITLAISYLTTLVNPYFLRLHLFAYQMFTNSDARKFNIDWMPHQLKGNPIANLSFLLTLILALLVIKAPRLKRHHRLLLTFYLLLSIFLSRFTIIFFVILIPLIPYAIQHLSPSPKIQRFAGASYTLLLMAFTVTFGVKNFRHTLLANSSPHGHAQVSLNYTLNYPISALRYLAHHPPQANLLNSINWGGYLNYSLPHLLIFADGKMDNYLINGETFLYTYQEIVQVSTNWEEHLESYRINSALLEPTNKLTATLREHPNWKLAYEDDISVLFLRRDPIKQPLSP